MGRRLKWIARFSLFFGRGSETGFRARFRIRSDRLGSRWRLWRLAGLGILRRFRGDSGGRLVRLRWARLRLGVLCVVTGARVAPPALGGFFLLRTQALRPGLNCGAPPRPGRGKPALRTGAGRAKKPMRLGAGTAVPCPYKGEMRPSAWARPSFVREN